MQTLNEHWAWEFLRRNEYYQRAFTYWKDGVDGAGTVNYSSKTKARLRQLIDRIPHRKVRYEPWLEAAFESGRPFFNEDFSGSGPRPEVDPLAYLLKKWVDPNTPYDQFDISLFEPPIHIDFAYLAPEKTEARLLHEMEVIAGNVSTTFEDNDFVYPIPSPALQFPEEYGIPRITLEIALKFDLTAPILPQLVAAKTAFHHEQGGIESLLGFKPIGMFEEIRSFKKEGLLDCLRIYDARLKHQKLSNAIRSVIQSEFTVDKFDKEYKRLEKAHTRAVWLVSHGYRQILLA